MIDTHFIISKINKTSFAFRHRENLVSSSKNPSWMLKGAYMDTYGKQDPNLQVLLSPVGTDAIPFIVWLMHDWYWTPLTYIEEEMVINLFLLAI